MSRQLSVSYDKVALQNAVEAVKSKSMGYLKASQVFKVPRSTIFDKVKERSSMDCSTGPHTTLTFDEEKRLADWLIEMSKIGYGRSKQELLDVVQKIIQADGRPTRFKNQRPGKDWYYSFMRRHPDISLRSPRQLGKERAIIRPEHIEKWFHDFEAFIRETSGDQYILKDPSRIYNADESGFCLSSKTGHVLGLRGAKAVYNITASDRSQITVLLGMSASAHFLRPMIVFPGQRFTRNMLEGFEEAVLGRSETGWMDSELFVSWLQTVFIPDIEERQVKKPVILLVDGHKTHMTMEASDICRENGIILYCLLEHASHLIQPCDLRLFASLKESWKIALREWQIEHVGQYVTKFEFAAIFKRAWLNSSKVENAVNGFRDAGLFPLDKSVVLKTDKFQTSTLFKKGEQENMKSIIQDKGSCAAGLDTENQDKDDSGHMLTATKIDDVEVRHVEDHDENRKTDQTQVTLTQEHNERTKEGEERQTEKKGEPVKVESPMSKYLKIPEVKQVQKRVVKREILPKAVTGEEFRKILMEKKRKREEEEEAKKMRKLERERKKLEKEKEKQLKLEQRLQKKKEREAEKSRKLRLKQLLKEKQKRKGAEPSDSESDCSMSDVCDDTDVEESFDSNVCYKCGQDGDQSGWIGCQKCFRFFHRDCTDIDFSEYTDDEIAAYPFECLFC